MYYIGFPGPSSQADSFILIRILDFTARLKDSVEASGVRGKSSNYFSANEEASRRRTMSKTMWISWIFSPEAEKTLQAGLSPSDFPWLERQFKAALRSKAVSVTLGDRNL